MGEQASGDVTGLVIKSPWIEKILAGEKTWEIRTTRASRRGRIALMRSRSGHVFGTARVVDCLGPLTMDEMLANADKHRVPEAELATYCKPGKTFAYVLADARPLAEPIPYRHPYGAVTWVTLTPEAVPDRFDELLAATR